MSKKKASEKTIMDFCKAVYPEYTELVISLCTEKEILQEATKIILEYREKEKK